MHREKTRKPHQVVKKRIHLGFIQWYLNQLNGRMCLFRDCRRTFVQCFRPKLTSESCRQLREMQIFPCVFQRRMNQFRWLRWFLHIAEHKLECENHPTEKSLKLLNAISPFGILKGPISSKEVVGCAIAVPGAGMLHVNDSGWRICPYTCTYTTWIQYKVGPYTSYK